MVSTRLSEGPIIRESNSQGFYHFGLSDQRAHTGGNNIKSTSKQRHDIPSALVSLIPVDTEGQNGVSISVRRIDVDTMLSSSSVLAGKLFRYLYTCRDL